MTIHPLQTCSRASPSVTFTSIFFFAAIDREPHRIARAVIVHHLAEVLLVLNILTIDRHNQVATQHDWHVAQIGALGAAVQSGAVRRASRHHLHDQQSVVRRPVPSGRPVPGVIGIVRTPSAGRRTRPSVIRSFSTAFAVLIGMAKPMPALCPTFEASWY